MLTIYDRDEIAQVSVQVWSGLRHFGDGLSSARSVAARRSRSGPSIAEEAVLQASQMGHVVTLYFVRQVTAYFEMIRGDSGRATPHWEACFNLAQEHGMKQPLLISAYGLAWVRWRTGVEKAEAQAAKMRDLRAQIREGHYLLFNPLYAKLLADVETGAGRAESALNLINETVSEVEQTGQSWFDAELYRARGEPFSSAAGPKLLLARRPLSTPST